MYGVVWAGGEVYGAVCVGGEEYGVVWMGEEAEDLCLGMEGYVLFGDGELEEMG